MLFPTFQPNSGPSSRWGRGDYRVKGQNVCLARRVAGVWGLRVKMCVWLGVSRGLDLAFLNAD